MTLKVSPFVGCKNNTFLGILQLKSMKTKNLFACICVGRNKPGAQTRIQIFKKKLMIPRPKDADKVVHVKKKHLKKINKSALIEVIRPKSWPILLTHISFNP